MRERAVGRSGLIVGEVGLGTLTWGRDTDEAEAQEQLRVLLDAGGSLLDTSPAFGQGAAEALIGTLLADRFPRERLVICTRAGFRSTPVGPRFGAGLGAIRDSVAESLARLGTDYLDILLLAAPDPLAPDEETAAALSGLVASGQVRYIGLMGYPAWRAAALQQLLAERKLPALIAIETEYSLLERSCEAEVVPMCEHMGMGLLANSPLGRGVLTGKYRHSIPPTSRAASEHLAAFVDPYLEERPRRIVEALARAADGLGRTPADVALGWVLGRPQVASALLGARTASQLTSVLGAIEDLPSLVAEALDDVTQ